MKVDILQRPYFALHLPASTALLLQRVSAVHYDSTCRKAGAVGGFIYGWVNSGAFNPGSPVHAEPREIDTAMKILEMAHHLLSGDELAELRDFKQSAAKAMVDARVWSSPPVLVL